MKKIILLMIVLCLFFSSIKGQPQIDSLKIDTIELHQHSIIIKYPAHFHKTESPLEYGGRSICYASKPPISLIVVMEAANTKMDFGKDCEITEKIESEHCYTEKGFCAFKGYNRTDYHRKTRVKVSYESVSECEYSLFEYILDSVIIIKKW